jgi:hypothetical protein
MDIIEFVVLITVIIVVINLFIVFWYLIFEDCIKSNVVGKEPILLHPFVARCLRSGLSQFSSGTRPVLIMSIIFYIIFYILYLIIIFIIPETGIATLFIPIRELLLKIPPFPDLIKYGVIKLMDDIVVVFGLKGHLLRFFSINLAFYVFSKENIKRIFNYIFPNLGDKIVEKMEIEEKNSDKRKIPELDNTNNIYKKIEVETDVCVAGSLIQITPDMSSSQVHSASFKNSMLTAKCHSKSVGKYIRSNN